MLEIKVSWETEKEGVVLSVDFPGPNYKVQVLIHVSTEVACQRNVSDYHVRSAWWLIPYIK